MVRSRKLADKSNSGTFSDTSDRKTLENRFPVPEKLLIYRISDMSESDTAKYICTWKKQDKGAGRESICSHLAVCLWGSRHLSRTQPGVLAALQRERAIEAAGACVVDVGWPASA